MSDTQVAIGGTVTPEMVRDADAISDRMTDIVLRTFEERVVAGAFCDAATLEGCLNDVCRYIYEEYPTLAALVTISHRHREEVPS